MTATIGYMAGPTVIWEPGGVAPNKAIPMANLAAYGGVQGDKSTAFLINGLLPAFIRWQLYTKLTTTVTTLTGLEVVLFVGQSDAAFSGSNNTLPLTGVSSALATTSTVHELFGLFDRVGVLPVSLALQTANARQEVWLTSYPRCPYQIPVVYNNSNTNLSLTNSDHRIAATPYYQYLV